MRKVVEQVVVNGFLKHRAKSLGATVSTGDQLFLHGNLIAEWCQDGECIRWSLAGWNTPTTKSRLNAIPGVYVSNSGGHPFWNGVMIDSRAWYEVNLAVVAFGKITGE